MNGIRAPGSAERGMTNLASRGCAVGFGRTCPLPASSFSDPYNNLAREAEVITSSI